MDIIGKLHSIDNEVQITENFRKQMFILDLTRYNQDTGEVYENYSELQINNGRIDLSGFSLGQKVKVTFFISGRYYDKKDGSGKGFFQNLIAASIEAFGNNKTQQRTQQTQSSQPGGNYNDYSNDEPDDLPF